MSIGPAQRRTSRARPFLLGSALLVIALVACAAWVGVRAMLVKDELQALVPVVGELQEAAAARDTARLTELTSTLTQRSDAAAALTSDPLWRAAEVIPVAGANLTAVRVVSAQLKNLNQAAVTPLVELVTSMEERGAASDDGFDLTLATDSRAPLRTAASALHSAAETFGSFPRSGLIPEVRGAVDQLDAGASAAAPAVDALARAASIAPAMLGADGQRTILVMLQNNAELRTGGGITGSFVLLRAEGGRISIMQQSDSSDFPSAGGDILPIPASTSTLYGDVVGRFVQNASATADFTLSAQLAGTWWQQRFGDTPDAVLSIDPLVLRALLGATGPVEMPDGSQLTSDNLVQRLLVDPYLTLDSDAQNEFLQGVTAAVFSKITASPDMVAWAEALAGPAEQGRISLWSAHPGEQATIEGTAIAGPAARHAAAGDDAFAVYFNDVTGGKMDVFLDVDITAGTAECRGDGRRDISIVLTMSSLAPADADGGLPRSVTGGGLLGTANGDIGTIVTVAAPPGTFFGGVWKNGEPEVSSNVIDNGFPSTGARVNLSPGEVNTMEFRFVAAEPGALDPEILHTPLIEEPGIIHAPAVCRG